jgi:hypothetical protein
MSTMVPSKGGCLLPLTSPSPARYVSALCLGLAQLLPHGLWGWWLVLSHLPPKDTYCNLGWTLLATDADGDGRHDLVISSPFAPGGGKQRGIVATFYSHPRRNDKGRCWSRGGAEITASLWLPWHLLHVGLCAIMSLANRRALMLTEVVAKDGERKANEGRWHGSVGKWLPAMADNLSSISRTHMVERTDSWNVVLWPPHVCHGTWVHTQTHTP